MAKSTYVATKPLTIGRARAHNVGDLVPEENIKRNGWEDGTATTASQAGRRALGLPEDATQAEATAAAHAASATPA